MSCVNTTTGLHATHFKRRGKRCRKRYVWIRHNRYVVPCTVAGSFDSDLIWSKFKRHPMTTVRKLLHWSRSRIQDISPSIGINPLDPIICKNETKNTCNWRDWSLDEAPIPNWLWYIILLCLKTVETLENNWKTLGCCCRMYKKVCNACHCYIHKRCLKMIMHRSKYYPIPGDI